MVTISAGFWIRLTAFGLDYLLIAVYAAVVFLVIRLLNALGLELATSAFFLNPLQFDLLAFFTLVLPVMLYFALSEASSFQATWGKWKMDLRVSTLNGQRLGLPRSLLRSGVKFLPWQIAHTSLFNIPGWPMNVQQLPPGSILGFVIVWALAGRTARRMTGWQGQWL